jgi:hypothetical protein
MGNFNVLAAVAAALLIGGPAVAEAKDKPEQPKVKKVCRTELMSGRITPQRICRKVERPAPEQDGQRDAATSNESAGRSN